MATLLALERLVRLGRTTGVEEMPRGRGLLWGVQSSCVSFWRPAPVWLRVVGWLFFLGKLLALGRGCATVVSGRFLRDLATTSVTGFGSAKPSKRWRRDSKTPRWTGTAVAKQMASWTSRRGAAKRRPQRPQRSRGGESGTKASSGSCCNASAGLNLSDRQSSGGDWDLRSRHGPGGKPSEAVAPAMPELWVLEPTSRLRRKRSISSSYCSGCSTSSLEAPGRERFRPAPASVLQEACQADTAVGSQSGGRHPGSSGDSPYGEPGPWLGGSKRHAGPGD